ncbi:MAG: hypothetical protein WB706_07295 [Nitrososphaeraceae archaeon]
MNWKEIISNRTPVQTKDLTRFGYVAGEYKDSLVVIQGKLVSHGYVIPKAKVDHYDGRELSLNMRYDEISRDYEL